MSTEELWNYFRERKVSSEWRLDREFVWVPIEDFEQVKKHFLGEFNVFQKGISMRSHGLLRHIHAVDQGSHMFIHKDTGNVARFFPLGIVHLLLDVIPHETYARVKGPRKLYYRPKSEPQK